MPRKPPAETYRDRNLLLERMGFPTYSHYLDSELWSQVRNAAAELHGSRCVLCHSNRIIFHHVSYAEAVLTGQDLSAIVPLCHRCHERVEFRKDGSKRTLANSQRQLAILIAKKNARTHLRNLKRRRAVFKKKGRIL